MHLVSFALHLSLAFTFRYMWMRIFFNLEYFPLLIHQHTCRQGLCIMGLTCSWKIKNELHFFPGDVIQLRTLRQLRSCWQVAVFGDLVVCDHILSVRFCSWPTGYG